MLNVVLVVQIMSSELAGMLGFQNVCEQMQSFLIPMRMAGLN